MTRHRHAGRSSAGRILALLRCLAPLCLLAGCSAGDIKIGEPEPPKVNVLVKPVNADTSAAITATGTVIVGSVRADNVGGADGMLVSKVPLEALNSSNVYVVPLTVTIRGYVTKMQTLEFSVAENREVQVQLTPADLALTGTVTGKVASSADASGVPLATVALTPNLAGEVTTVSGGTDSTGAFVISGVPTGEVNGTASADGFLTGTKTFAVIQDSSPASPTTVNFELVPDSTKATLTGVVRRMGTGEPVAGATVTVGDLAPVTTNASGEFTVTEVTVGERTITVKAAGFIDYSATVFVLPDMGQVQIQLARSEDEPPPGPSNIRGTVTITNRADSSGATVRAVDLGSLEVADTAVTGADGSYGLFVLPGTYRLTVTYDTVSISRTVTLGSGGRVLTGVDFAIAAP